MDDESPTPRATRRVSRAEPADAPRPSDSDPLATARILPSEDLEQQEFDLKVHVKRCVLCDYAEIPHVKTKEDMDAHVRSVHARKLDGSREEPRPCVTFCTWVCSVCGKESRYPTNGVEHGGPPVRALDRRFAFAYCRDARYPAHKRALGRIDGAAGPVVLYHEGMTFSGQPVQDDPTLEAFLPKKKESNVRSATKQNRERAGLLKPATTARARRMD